MVTSDETGSREMDRLLGRAALTVDCHACHRLGPARGKYRGARDVIADVQLRNDAALHARRWFDQYAERSLCLVGAVPEGRDTQLDDLHLVGGLLESALHVSTPNEGSD